MFESRFYARQFVIDVDDGTTWMPEHELNPLCVKCANEDLGTRHEGHPTVVAVSCAAAGRSSCWCCDFHWLALYFFRSQESGINRYGLAGLYLRVVGLLAPWISHYGACRSARNRPRVATQIARGNLRAKLGKVFHPPVKLFVVNVKPDATPGQVDRNRVTGF